jgi:hypothetical protein
VNLWVDGHLIENTQIAQWTEKLARENRRKEAQQPGTRNLWRFQVGLHRCRFTAVPYWAATVSPP